MVFRNLCVLVLWMKVALALEGLTRLPASQGPKIGKFSTVSFGNLLMNSRLFSSRDIQVAIKSILYIFQILNDMIRHLAIFDTIFIPI